MFPSMEAGGGVPALFPAGLSPAPSETLLPSRASAFPPVAGLICFCYCLSPLVFRYAEQFILFLFML